MYWREYRTEFHIGITYGVSEATVCRTIQRVENVLMKSGEFRLPGRKVLQPSDTLIEVVLIDATEQPIERLKKSSVSTPATKKTSHSENAVNGRPKDASHPCHRLCQWKPAWFWIIQRKPMFLLQTYSQPGRFWLSGLGQSSCEQPNNLPRNRNFIRWPKSRRRATGNFLMSVFWSRTSFASWRFFGSWVNDIEIGANVIHLDSISLPLITTLNWKTPNDLPLQEVYCLASR